MNFSRWYLNLRLLSRPTFALIDLFFLKTCFLFILCFFSPLVLMSLRLSVPSGLFTLTGLLVYLQYCSQAMEDFKQTVPPEKLATVDVSYGWSLAIAWLSYSLEVACGLLLMLAARITLVKRRYDSGTAVL